MQSCEWEEKSRKNEKRADGGSGVAPGPTPLRLSATHIAASRVAYAPGRAASRKPTEHSPPDAHLPAARCEGRLSATPLSQQGLAAFLVGSWARKGCQSDASSLYSGRGQNESGEGPFHEPIVRCTSFSRWGNPQDRVLLGKERCARRTGGEGVGGGEWRRRGGGGEVEVEGWW